MVNSQRNSQVVVLDVLRSLDHASISGTYAAVGTPFAIRVRLICLTNNTDGDMFFSYDGTNDNLFIAKGSFKLFDLCTNRVGYGENFVLPIGTQFYVRQSTAPTTGAVYIEAVMGN